MAWREHSSPCVSSTGVGPGYKSLASSFICSKALLCRRSSQWLVCVVLLQLPSSRTGPALCQAVSIWPCFLTCFTDSCLQRLPCLGQSTVLLTPCGALSLQSPGSQPEWVKQAGSALCSLSADILRIWGGWS